MAQQRATFTWNGEEASDLIRAAAVKGLHVWSELLLEESRRLVPLDEGTLERSGVASVDPLALTASVSYDTPYAVRQHEDMTLRHPNGRQPKYLEEPFLRLRRTAATIIANRIRREIGE